jgi:hypothetical protein
MVAAVAPHLQEESKSFNKPEQYHYQQRRTLDSKANLSDLPGHLFSFCQSFHWKGALPLYGLLFGAHIQSYCDFCLAIQMGLWQTKKFFEVHRENSSAVPCDQIAIA